MTDVLGRDVGSVPPTSLTPTSGVGDVGRVPGRVLNQIS
jgi:hypothetical protein